MTLLLQGEPLHALTPPPKADGGVLPEGTCLARPPIESNSSSSLLVAGYSDGSIRFWDLHKGTVQAKLVGHRKAITALTFSADGAHVASGSKDTDIVVRDVADETGLNRLKGHRDQV